MDYQGKQTVSRFNRIGGRLAVVVVAVGIAVTAPLSASASLSASTFTPIVQHGPYPSLQECNRQVFRDVELGYEIWVQCKKFSSGWWYQSTRR